MDLNEIGRIIQNDDIESMKRVMKNSNDFDPSTHVANAYKSGSVGVVRLMLACENTFLVFIERWFNTEKCDDLVYFRLICEFANEIQIGKIMEHLCRCSHEDLVQDEHIDIMFDMGIVNKFSCVNWGMLSLGFVKKFIERGLDISDNNHSMFRILSSYANDSLKSHRFIYKKTYDELREFMDYVISESEIYPFRYKYYKTGYIFNPDGCEVITKHLVDKKYMDKVALTMKVRKSARS